MSNTLSPCRHCGSVGSAKVGEIPSKLGFCIGCVCGMNTGGRLTKEQAIACWNHMPLARFGHHHDPAIDYCVEVDCLEAMAADLEATGKCHNDDDTPATIETFKARMQRALDFIVGGDPYCVKARGALLELDAKALPKPYIENDAERAKAFAEVAMANGVAIGQMAIERAEIDNLLTAAGVPLDDHADEDGRDLTLKERVECLIHYWKEAE